MHQANQSALLMNSTRLHKLLFCLFTFTIFLVFWFGCILDPNKTGYSNQLVDSYTHAFTQLQQWSWLTELRWSWIRLAVQNRSVWLPYNIFIRSSKLTTESKNQNPYANQDKIVHAFLTAINKFDVFRFFRYFSLVKQTIMKCSRFEVKGRASNLRI